MQIEIRYNTQYNILHEFTSINHQKEYICRVGNKILYKSHHIYDKIELSRVIKKQELTKYRNEEIKRSHLNHLNMVKQLMRDCEIDLILAPEINFENSYALAC